MSNFLIKISYYAPYPREKEYRQEAGGLHTAISRAIREWKKEIKGKRIKEVSIKAIKL